MRDGRSLAKYIHAPKLCRVPFLLVEILGQSTLLVSSSGLTTVIKAIKYFRDVWAFLLEDASESVIQYLYIGQ